VAGNLLAVELVRRHFPGADLDNAGAEPLQSDDRITLSPAATPPLTSHWVADGRSVFITLC